VNSGPTAVVSEDMSSPPVWDWQQSPPAVIEQWLGASVTARAMAQPVRQFKPPLQSSKKSAPKGSKRFHLFSNGKITGSSYYREEEGL